MIYDTHNFNYDWACNYFAVFPVSWDNYVYADLGDTMAEAATLAGRPKNSDACCLSGVSRKEMWGGKKYNVVMTGWTHY